MVFAGIPFTALLLRKPKAHSVLDQRKYIYHEATGKIPESTAIPNNLSNRGQRDPCVRRKGLNCLEPTIYRFMSKSLQQLKLPNNNKSRRTATRTQVSRSCARG